MELGHYKHVPWSKNICISQLLCAYLKYLLYKQAISMSFNYKMAANSLHFVINCFDFNKGIFITERTDILTNDALTALQFHFANMFRIRSVAPPVFGSNLSPPLRDFCLSFEHHDIRDMSATSILENYSSRDQNFW